MNFAANGSDIYERSSYVISVFVDTFTVIQPTDYHVFPLNKFNFDILTSKVEQIENNVFVSPNGDNKNSGLTPTEPLASISLALCRILVSEVGQSTINLATGKYSSSTTSEYFPFNMVNNVSILGQSKDGVIIDAEGKNMVMMFFEDNGIILKNLMISGGSTLQGGGINCHKSNPIMENIFVSGNYADDGGAFVFHKSEPILTSVTIAKNIAEKGGAIYCRNSILKLTGVTITANQADFGGGIFCMDSGRLILTNTILWNDIPQEIYFSDIMDSNLITISYSIIQGGNSNSELNNNGAVNWQYGNLYLDPLFFNAQNNNYNLQWGSPAIDTGDPNSELDPDGTRADIGAFPFDQSQFILDFALFPNYPNPFNSSTTIHFDLPEETHIIIVIQNILGQTIKILPCKFATPPLLFTVSIYHVCQQKGTHHCHPISLIFQTLHQIKSNIQ